MYISLNEFLVLAKKYQALGAPTQALLDEMRRGNFRVHDEVRLGKLLEFLTEMKYVHGCSEEVHNMASAVERVLIQSHSEDEQIIVAEKWVPERGFPGATLWIQREDGKWSVSPVPREGICPGKRVGDLDAGKWLERPVALLIDKK